MRDVQTQEVHDRLVRRLVAQDRRRARRDRHGRRGRGGRRQGRRARLRRHGATGQGRGAARPETRASGVSFCRPITIWPFPITPDPGGLRAGSSGCIVPEMNLGQLAREIERHVDCEVVPLSKIGGVIHSSRRDLTPRSREAVSMMRDLIDPEFFEALRGRGADDRSSSRRPPATAPAIRSRACVPDDAESAEDRPQHRLLHYLRRGDPADDLLRRLRRRHGAQRLRPRHRRDAIDPREMVCVTGIGCSSWIPSPYFLCDTLHTTHGRAIAFASGVKVMKPDMKVIIIAGDGDLAGIGGNHLIHAARRNIDLTVFLVNNFIYGMTGGQVSPTTPFGVAHHDHALPQRRAPLQDRRRRGRRRAAATWRAGPPTTPSS